MFNRKIILASAAAVMAAFSLSCMDSVMKHIMAQGVSPWFAQGVRGWAILVGIMAVMAFTGQRDFRLVRAGGLMMAVRGVLMFGSSILIFIAIAPNRTDCQL